MAQEGFQLRRNDPNCDQPRPNQKIMCRGHSYGFFSQKYSNTHREVQGQGNMATDIEAVAAVAMEGV